MVFATLLVVAIVLFRRRAVAQRAAHDARLSAMAQAYLAAAKRKKAAEAAAAGNDIPAVTVAPAPSATAPVRDERECPFCAELILKKAKVCKHCNRDV